MLEKYPVFLWYLITRLIDTEHLNVGPSGVRALLVATINTVIFSSAKTLLEATVCILLIQFVDLIKLPLSK